MSGGGSGRNKRLEQLQEETLEEELKRSAELEEDLEVRRRLRRLGGRRGQLQFFSSRRFETGEPERRATPARRRTPGAPAPRPDRGGADAGGRGGQGGAAGGGEGGGSGGPDGGAEGGGCFAKGTQVLMANGRRRAIETMVIGDQVHGGKVTGVMVYQVLPDTMVMLHGIHVHEDHPLNDNGTWRYAAEADGAERAPDTAGRVVHLVNVEPAHRVHVVNADGEVFEYTDFAEIPTADPLYKVLWDECMVRHQADTDRKRAA